MKRKSVRFKEAIRNPNCGWVYFVSSSEFTKIPGSPIAYWLSIKILEMFLIMQFCSEILLIPVRIDTTDTARFVKNWFEVPINKIGFDYKNSLEAKESGKKWFPFNKGGPYRKWYGNNFYVLNYYNDGEELKLWVVNNPNDPSTSSWARYIRSPEYYFKKSITWTKIASSMLSVRYSPNGYIFSDASNGAFPKDKEIGFIIGLLNSIVSQKFLEVLAPTLNFKSGDIAKVPIIPNYLDYIQTIEKYTEPLISIAKDDWDSWKHHGILQNLLF